MSTLPHTPRTRKAHKYMSLQKYLAGPPDEFKAELIYGEKIVSPSPTADHQDAILELAQLLKRWTRLHDLGRVSHDLDMVLDELKDLAYRPDILFVAKEHAERWKAGRVFGPADLCVEVLSPSDRPRVRNRKYADYESYGVAWYWVIDPNRADPLLEEHELVEGRFVCRTEVVGDTWFEPGLFPGLYLRLPPLLTGDLKAAVKGKAKKLV
jgi:Uma2 family endonuclease